MQDLKKSEKLIDECFDAFDSIIKKIHQKDVTDVITNILKKSVLNLLILHQI